VPTNNGGTTYTTRKDVFMADEVTNTEPVSTEPTQEQPNTQPTQTDAPDTTKAEVKDIIETAAPQQTHRITVDGQEIEVTTEELIRNFGKGKAADKRFNEAAQMRKQAEGFINKLKSQEGFLEIAQDPRLGLDLEDIAEKFLMNKIRQSQMSPEEKSTYEKLQRLEALEREKEEVARLQAEKENAALQAKYTEDYQKDIISALDQSGLPATEHTVKRMAYYLSKALEEGYELKSKDVVDLVKADYINEIKSLYGKLDGQKLMEMLGEDVAKKIRATDLSRIKNPIKKQESRTSEIPNQSIGKRKTMTTKEFRKALEKDMKGE